MGFINDELRELKTQCESLIANSKLVSCLQIMVRVHIQLSEVNNLVVCAQFPKQYPNDSLLVELKSKTLSPKLLQKLTDTVEEETKKLLGSRQTLKVLQFLRAFFKNNPLSFCYDEIAEIRKTLNCSADELKLRQKSSTIILKAVNNEYYFAGKIVVPDNYPLSSIRLQDADTNFPPAFYRHIIANANEIARQCVEAPLRKKPKDPPFRASPSLKKTAAFLIDCIKRLPNENCQFCDLQCFPTDSKCMEINENNPNHIERVYCGHLFHQKCLLDYLKSPPFGNKNCKTCLTKISHHKWTISDKMAENRWAHEKARERELSEIEDFFK